MEHGLPVIMMTRPTSGAPLGHEFDTFLFAPIGEENNDMSLSVLSALARSDVDPWQEAATLRDLPKEVAILRLASLIQKLPAEHSIHLDAQKIAHRLMTLLPAPAGAIAAVRDESIKVGAIKDPQVSMLLFFVVSVLVAISLTAHHKTPLRAENERPVIHDGYSPKLPSSGRPMAGTLRGASE
jgi:hypothetical protein